MKKDDIELPPMPPLHIAPSVEPVDYPEVAQALMDYARAAIEPYKQLIEELEAQLEAVGAGGVSARRITSAPSNASAKITERSQAYLDGNLDSDEHAAFIKWAREAHDYPDYARLTLDSEWCQGAFAGWQGAIEAARQRGGEPVGEIRPDDQCDDEVWAEIWADLPPGTKLYAEPVQKAQKECSKDAERSAPVKVPSDSELAMLFGMWGWKTPNGRELRFIHFKEMVGILLEQYGHPVEPEGWRLVPKEPTYEMIQTLWETITVNHDTTDGGYKAMLEAAPKFGEEL